jgi:YidC/Oxa1 family membrane protein insertase
MEKRTLLAFVLSIAVVLAWSLLYSPKSQKAPKKEEPPAETVQEKKQLPKASVAPHRVAPEVPSKTAPVSTSKVHENEVEVDTPLFKAVFSNVGPTIRSFKLKDYHQTTEPNSPLIDLVNLKQGMGDFLLLNFSSTSTPAGDKTVYQVHPEGIHMEPDSLPKQLVFTSTGSNGVFFNQIFRFYPNQYRIDLRVEVVNRSGKAITGAFSSVLKAFPHSEKKRYYSYVGLALLLDDELEQVKVKKVSDEKVLNGQIYWMAYEDDFFMSAVIPDEPSKGVFTGRLLPSGVLEGTFLKPPLTLKASEEASTDYILYFGPRELGILKQLGKKLDRAVNFGWTDIIAKPLLYVLRFFNKYINNYGVSIILLTILIKILFWPLTHKSYKSMGEMKKIQPHMAKLREKYKDNKEQLNKEMMALYKTYKVNPLGGCLPMIIQIPVFFALYRILGNAIELRQAPFMLWINDLSAPDRLFHFNFSFKVPLMSPPYGIPVLTLLMGASMFVQQKMTPTPGDPSQAKVMMFLPIVFTFLFINFPSGLVLYWLVNNLLSIGQQYYIQKKSA